MSSTIRDEAKTELQMHLTDQKKSALRKYQDMVIGSPRLMDLILYECVMFICS